MKCKHYCANGMNTCELDEGCPNLAMGDCIVNGELTNADVIRFMTDEELATFLSEWAERCVAWHGEYGETLNWLKEPAKEG